MHCSMRTLQRKHSEHALCVIVVVVLGVVLQQMGRTEEGAAYLEQTKQLYGDSHNPYGFEGFTQPDPAFKERRLYR